MKGAPKVTIYDIAAEAGVSPATVSRVLNHRELVKPPTVERVLGAMDRLGFARPDRGKPGRVRAKAPARAAGAPGPLIVFNVPNLTNPFYGEIVRGAQAAANKNGYHLLVDCKSITGINVDSLINLIRDFGVAGLVVADAIPDPVLAALQELVPVVQCCEYNPESGASFVGIDNYAASKRAVEYILSTGRRRVAFFSTPHRFLYARQRQEAYADALRHAGVSLRREWLLYVPEVDFELAFRAAQGLLAAAPIPDAIFCVSDVLASAAIKASHTAGLEVPGDVLVVGFDNVDIAVTTTPAITTVEQPKYQLGHRAVELLVEQMLGASPPGRQNLLNTELIIRESSML